MTSAHDQSPNTQPPMGCTGTPRAEAIARRIRDKQADYDSYQFTQAQSGALNIFFDLVQEFDGEDSFHAICVQVPKIIFDMDCALYLVTKDLTLRCAGSSGSGAEPPKSAPKHPDKQNGHFYFPIRANAQQSRLLPFALPDDIIGCLEIHPTERMEGGDVLFWEKYANRIGFQMHNRLIHGTNKRHLRFIRNLAKDIGHNVIVPNMYFKLYFNRLKRSIDKIGALQQGQPQPQTPEHQALAALHNELSEQFDEISQHYEQTSLYLETLLRQSHFEKGHYVLERRDCDLETTIIKPQLHHYLSRFEENNIQVRCDSEDKPCTSLPVDVGLMAQVFSNLFSNALKYTAAPPAAPDGDKAMTCRIQDVPDAFGKGRDGVRFEVETTGTPIDARTGRKLFNAGVRGEDAQHVEGTGHGLFFVRQIVELHSGRVEHEPRENGNAFILTLPAALPEGDQP